MALISHKHLMLKVMRENAFYKEELYSFSGKKNIIPIVYKKGELIELLDTHNINYNKAMIDTIMKSFDEDGVPPEFEPYFNKMIEIFEKGIVEIIKSKKV